MLRQRVFAQERGHRSKKLNEIENPTIWKDIKNGGIKEEKHRGSTIETNRATFHASLHLHYMKK